MMNAQQYAAIIKIVSTKLNVQQADNTIIRNVSTYVKKLDIMKLNIIHTDKDELYETIANLYLASIQPQEAFYNSKQIETTKQEIARDNVKDALSTWSDSSIPILSSKSMLVYIDSRVRNVAQSSATDFSFTLVPRQTRSEIGDGRIQVRTMPSQVTFFKIGNIIMPYTSNMRSRNYTKEITITFTALRSNGIIGHDDTYHFHFHYSIINDTLVELTPSNAYCKFSPQLRLVDNISIRFNDPIYPIRFSVDRIRPHQFNYQSSDGRISFSRDHGLNDGDIVIISGLTTNNNSINYRLLEQINDPRGVIVTKISDTLIATDINFSQIQFPDITSLPTILIYSRMFRFPLEIGYQDTEDLH